MMKAVLQHTKTGLYFKSPGEWTNELDEAFFFPDTGTAMKFYSEHYLPDVKIVVRANGSLNDPPGT